jgi:hypothetical protein
VAATLLLASAAFAADPKIDVQTEVVLAQEKGASLDPPELSKMQAALKPKKHYGTMKRLSSSKLTLTSKPTPVSLPSGGSGELSLLGVKDDVATVRLKVGAIDSTLKLGAQGSLYQHAGAYQGGDLWVVLSRPK